MDQEYLSRASRTLRRRGGILSLRRYQANSSAIPGVRMMVQANATQARHGLNEMVLLVSGHRCDFREHPFGDFFTFNLSPHLTRLGSVEFTQSVIGFFIGGSYWDYLIPMGL